MEAANQLYRGTPVEAVAVPAAVLLWLAPALLAAAGLASMVRFQQASEPQAGVLFCKRNAASPLRNGHEAWSQTARSCHCQAEVWLVHLEQTVPCAQVAKPQPAARAASGSLRVPAAPRPLQRTATPAQQTLKVKAIMDIRSAVVLGIVHGPAAELVPWMD